MILPISFVRNFIKNLQLLNTNGYKYKLISNHFQKKYTECGLYFIISMSDVIKRSQDDLMEQILYYHAMYQLFTKGKVL